MNRTKGKRHQTWSLAGLTHIIDAHSVHADVGDEAKLLAAIFSEGSCYQDGLLPLAVTLGTEAASCLGDESHRYLAFSLRSQFRDGRG